jgi:Short C-terminal domain
MQERAAAESARSEKAFREYVKETASSGTSTADELAKLADLHDRGALSDTEYEKAKAKVVHDQPAPATGSNQQPASTSTTT